MPGAGRQQPEHWNAKGEPDSIEGLAEVFMVELFVKGGPVMYLILACSIITMTVILERLFFWIREDMRRNQSLVDDVLELSRKGEWEEVRRKVAGSKDYVIRILVNGILHREFSMAKAMEAAAADEMKRMRRYLAVLDTMITAGPLLGIFGSVIGIIRSFGILGTGGIERPLAITAGIAEALIATAGGLAIAIPSVFFFNYFNSRAGAAAMTIEKYATSLEIVYQKLIHPSSDSQG
jgi:biopolymer transport protein ExbB